MRRTILREGTKQTRPYTVIRDRFDVYESLPLRSSQQRDKSAPFRGFVLQAARFRAAFCAAWERPLALFVRPALTAERCRAAGSRLRAVLRACLDNAFFDAPLRPSRFNALLVARERRADGFCRDLLRPLLRSRLACALV